MARCDCLVMREAAGGEQVVMIGHHDEFGTAGRGYVRGGKLTMMRRGQTGD